MTLLVQLKANKGTVSSALGKELARKVLDGDSEILSQAIDLTRFEPDKEKSKNVRAGAAKIVEKVAENKPELVSPYLEKLIPALEMPEPQTKWMLMMALGYCAKLNPEIAVKGVEYAKKFITEKQGLGVVGASEIYLGHIGGLSPKEALKVLPILLDALDKALVNEVDWIIEALINICDNLKESDKEVILNYARIHLDAPKKSTIKRVERLIKKASAV